MSVPITRVRIGDWWPDAWVTDDGDIELAVTAPIEAHQVILVIPAAAARAWVDAAHTRITARLDQPGGPLEDP